MARFVFLFCLGLALALGSAPASQATSPQLRAIAGPEIVLYAAKDAAHTRVIGPETRLRAKAASTMTFQVTYVGSWPAAAQAAFDYALSIWASTLRSTVPVRVEASWENLGGGVLGSAGPWLSSGNAPGLDPQAFYPYALIDARLGSDIDPSRVDITAHFNSNQPSWYFGTDGNPPSGTFDFVSVVLHEFGHGLGFTGSASVSGGQGSWGFSGTPFIYDRFAQNGTGQNVLDTALFPNPSTALATQLQSGSLFWSGAAAQANNGNAKPKLYSPPAWQQGSSFSHLDESTYPAGNINSLMTPALAPTEVIHSPGPITRGIMQDIGWQLQSLNLPNKLYLPYVRR